MVAEFSKDAMQLMFEIGLDNKAAVTALLKHYQEVIPLDGKRFKQLVSNAIDEFTQVANVLTADIPQSFLLRITSTGGSKGKEGNRGPAGSAQTRSDGLAETQLLTDETIDTVQQVTKPLKRPNQEIDTEILLLEGLQEVTGLLMEEHSMSEIFNVVLETMYRSMDFQRVVLALLNRTTHEMAGRLGFGSNADDFVKNFRFSTEYSVDVFHGALKNAVDVYIANTGEGKIQADIPDWYKRISRAGSFLLFPLVINHRPLGLIYADHELPNGLDIDKKKLNLLKSLRNQIVLAVR
jgi:hypothetical protein